MKLMHNRIAGDVIALDIGLSRTGVARINTTARIAEALEPITDSHQQLVSELKKVFSQFAPAAVVLGLPRGLDGQDTEQTTYVRGVFKDLTQAYPDMNFFMIDEAGTTKEAELRARDGESVDSVAAGIIGEDFLAEIIRGNIDGVTL